MFCGIGAVILALGGVATLTAQGGEPAVPAPKAAQALGKPAAVQVFVGGVLGVEDLCMADNSKALRAAGGGLYLHNSAWGQSKPEQRRQVLENFKGRAVMVEIGFGAGADGEAWAKSFRGSYLDYGIVPAFITANAFDNNNKPTAEQWSGFMQALRAVGVPQTARIMPTFEYANFADNIPTLSQNTVSLSPRFQAMITAAGGLTLDSPCGYFFEREQAYRDWVVDAIRWTRAHGGTAVWIASPHNTGNKYGEEAEKLLRYLAEHDAWPDVIACENYSQSNPVGNDNDRNTPIGLGRWLLTDLLPMPGPQTYRALDRFYTETAQLTPQTVTYILTLKRPEITVSCQISPLKRWNPA